MIWEELCHAIDLSIASDPAAFVGHVFLDVLGGEDTERERIKGNADVIGRRGATWAYANLVTLRASSYLMSDIVVAGPLAVRHFAIVFTGPLGV